jgi:hypothetical protein
MKSSILKLKEIIGKQNSRVDSIIGGLNSAISLNGDILTKILKDNYAMYNDGFLDRLEALIKRVDKQFQFRNKICQCGSGKTILDMGLMSGAIVCEDCLKETLINKEPIN